MRDTSSEIPLVAEELYSSFKEAVNLLDLVNFWCTSNSVPTQECLDSLPVKSLKQWLPLTALVAPHNMDLYLQVLLFSTLVDNGWSCLSLPSSVCRVCGCSHQEDQWPWSAQASKYFQSFLAAMIRSELLQSVLTSLLNLKQTLCNPFGNSREMYGMIQKLWIVLYLLKEKRHQYKVNYHGWEWRQSQFSQSILKHQSSSHPHSELELLSRFLRG